MTPYIVFWKNNGRIGSVELNESNLKDAHTLMNLGLIQKDFSGTMHFEVFGAVSKQKEKEYVSSKRQ